MKRHKGLEESRMQEIFTPWSWDMSSFWYIDVFANQKTLQIPLNWGFNGRFLV